MTIRKLKTCPRCGTVLLRGSYVETGTEIPVWLCHNDACELNAAAVKQRELADSIGGFIWLTVQISKIAIALVALYAIARLFLP